MWEFKSIDYYLAERGYTMAGLLTRASFDQFRKDWREWKPNPLLNRAENHASDVRVAKEYNLAAHKGIKLLFRIAWETRDESNRALALDRLVKFEGDVQSSQTGGRVEITDGGIAFFAEYSLLRLDPTDQELRKFIMGAYIHEGHFDGALQVAHCTPLETSTEKLVLELVKTLPSKYEYCPYP